MIADVDGRPVFVKNTDPPLVRERETLRVFLQWVSQACTEVGGASLLNLAPAVRSQLTEIVGESTVEAIAVAADDAHVLWTEEMVTDAMQREFGLGRRVWSQVVVRGLTDGGLLPETEYDRVCGLLAVADYRITQISPSTVCGAGELSAWDPSSNPLRSVLALFGRADYEGTSLARVGLVSMKEVWRRCSSTTRKDEIWFELLRNLATRNDGARLLEHMLRAVDPVFGINVIGAAEARTLLLSAARGLGGPSPNPMLA